MASRKFTTKGVKHAALLVPASGGPGAPTEHDIKGVNKLDFTFDTTEVEVWGDDALETVWVSGLKGTLKFVTSHLDPDILALITGNVVTTTNAGLATQEDEIYLGTEKLYVTTPQMFLFQFTTRDENETARLCTVWFFNASVTSDPKFDGMDTKGVSTYAWDFNTKPAATDEKGSAITPVSAIARLKIGPATP